MDASSAGHGVATNSCPVGLQIRRYRLRSAVAIVVRFDEVHRLDDLGREGAVQPPLMAFGVGQPVLLLDDGRIELQVEDRLADLGIEILGEP